MQQNRLVRWWMQSFLGIDRRRQLPALHFNNFRRWFAKRRVSWNTALNPQLGQVILLDDCFTTYNEPAIGKAAVKLLDAAGIGVELADSTCCGRTLISKGYLAEARELIQSQAPRLAARIAEGSPILGLEPSCLLTLVDEWPELAPGPATSLIARSRASMDAWLAKQLRKGSCASETEYSVLSTQYSALNDGDCTRPLSSKGACRRWKARWTLLKQLPISMSACSTPAAAAWQAHSAMKATITTSACNANLDLLPPSRNRRTPPWSRRDVRAAIRFHDPDRAAALHPPRADCGGLRIPSTNFSLSSGLALPGSGERLHRSGVADA